jgi:hypothetical protein
MGWLSRRRRAQDSSLDLDTFAQATSLSLTDNLNFVLTETEDRDTIRRLLELIGRYRDGWSTPRSGVPVATLKLSFSAPGGRPLGNVGLGTTFLSAHQAGAFSSRAVEEDVRAEALAVLGVTDPEGT